MNNTYKDIKYVLAAGILAASLILVGYGFEWGWYIGISYLGFNAAVLVLASGVLMNPDIFPQEYRQTYRNLSLQFLVQCVTVIFLYSLYNAGFAFTTGFFAFMLILSTMSNFLIALASLSKGKSK